MVQIINNLLQKIEGKVEAAAFNSKEQMKGLTQFITDIRKSREAEIKRVNKELANIRNKFRTDKNIDGYHRKKYIAKLVLIFLLGYEVNIGQSEAAFLLASTKLSEKQIGYLYLSLLSSCEDNDLNHIIINCLASDLCSVKYYNVMLAVNYIPFCINDDMVKELTPVLNKQLSTVPPENSEYQLYLICYLAFIKYDKEYIAKYPEVFNRIVKMYSASSDIMLLPITNILYEGALVNGDNMSLIFPTIIQHLFKLATISPSSPLTYYNIVSPWTIIKSLQLLQLLNPPNDSAVSLSKLLLLIFSLENPHTSSKSSSKKTHYANILNAIKFEAVSVVATKTVSEECLNQTYVYLSKMLSSAETNHRFLFLENLIKMKHTPSFQVIIKDFSQKLSDLIASEKNSGLRLQAVSVIYSVGDLSNVKKIVENMIKFLMNAEFCIREELALKICAIASKNISDARWYVDSMISVLLHGRDLTGEEVWFKIAQTVSEHKDIQEYSVKTLINFLNHPNSSENIAKLGVYLIGEYGHLVCQTASFSSQSQYSLVIGLFPFYSVSTKHIILTALAKMAFNQPTLMQQITNFFDNDMVTQNIDTELQQRACEYRQLLTKDNTMLSVVLSEMPVYELTESDECENEMVENADNKNFYPESIVSSATDLLSADESTKMAPSTESINSISSNRSHSPFIHFLLEVLSTIIEDAPQSQQNMLINSHQGQILNAAFLDRFPLSNNGILYEDQTMIVKMASVYNKSIGSHEIRLESTDPYIHFKVVNFSTTESSELLFSTYNPDCIKIFSGGCSFSFQSASNSPLSSGIAITIDLLSSNDLQNVKKLAFMLPISVINYMIPYTIESSNFVTIWNSMSSPELESIEIFEASRMFDSAYIVEKTMRLTVRSKLAELTRAISKKIISLL